MLLLLLLLHAGTIRITVKRSGRIRLLFCILSFFLKKEKEKNSSTKYSNSNHEYTQNSPLLQYGSQGFPCNIDDGGIKVMKRKIMKVETEDRQEERGYDREKDVKRQ